MSLAIGTDDNDDDGDDDNDDGDDQLSPNYRKSSKNRFFAEDIDPVKGKCYDKG